jgi:predicted SprT family Zn-dependent metalloprotease
MYEWKCYYCEKELGENESCNCEKSKERWGYITSNVNKSDKEYICTCGNNTFTMISHMDFSDSYSYTYRCTKCGNHIGLHFQRAESEW